MNTLRLFKKQWKFTALATIGILLYVVAIIQLFEMFPRHIQKGPLPLIVMFTGIISSVFAYIKFQTKKVDSKIEKLFKTCTLPEYLAFYDTLSFNLEKKEQQFRSTISRSMAMFIFGEFDKGMKEIERIDLSEFEPIDKALHLIAIVIHNYLQKKDLPLTLELAKQAKNIALQYKSYPGIKKTHTTYIVYYTIGKLLNGDFSAEVLQLLEKSFPKVYFLTRIQIAWALAIAYKKNGLVTKFKEMERYLLVNAPNCKPLHDFEL